MLIGTSAATVVRLDGNEVHGGQDPGAHYGTEVDTRVAHAEEIFGHWLDEVALLLMEWAGMTTVGGMVGITGIAEMTGDVTQTAQERSQNRLPLHRMRLKT